MQSLTSVTALELASQLPTEVTLSLLTIQEEVTFEKTLTAPVLRSIENKVGRPVLIKLVCAVLKLFADSLNITQTLSALQVYELAQLWIEQYPTDSLKDLILCLKRVKQGKYGKTFNRIDIQVISEFWTAYLNEKAEYRENQHLKQKAVEASNQLLPLKQIAEHAPQTAELIKRIARPTPSVAPVNAPTFDTYLSELSEQIPFASPDELAALLKQCQAAGNSMKPVVDLIRIEMASREPKKEAIQAELYE